jgi:hypothetical protein
VNARPGAAWAAVLGLVSTAQNVRAEMSAEGRAKLAQHPVCNLLSIPIQNNVNFNAGPQSGTQNIMNVQPVYPVTVNSDWNIITRTVLPLIWQLRFQVQVMFPK